MKKKKKNSNKKKIRKKKKKKKKWGMLESNVKTLEAFFETCS